jgi:hypothetical protein
MHALHRAQAPYEINPWNTSYQEARKNNGKIGITVIHVDKIDVRFYNILGSFCIK